MKLVNFASMDPAHRARGIKGLRGHSHGDEQVWNEFRQDWDQMAVRSETTLQHLRAAVGAAGPEDRGSVSATEKAATVIVRTKQTFFRKVVLAAYHSRCCVTQNPVEDLLVASHILPWSDFPEHRLNPKNGLCLAAHFDRAFDRGLVTFDTDLRLIVSPVLRRYLPNAALESEYLRREGQPLILPDRFVPEIEFLDYHRTRTFRRD
jgi:predicted restriction endonuclease